MSWQRALESVLRRAQPLLASGEPSLAVIGSVASALQGCPVTPRDIDLLGAHPEAVSRFADVMAPHAPSQSPHPADHPAWLSSQAQPLSIGPDDYGFVWHFGRWQVGGVTVEMAHLRAPQGTPTSADGAGIWEAGPEIWPHLRSVPFAGHAVPVVPLEIQLQTALARGLQDRAAQIAAVLRQAGYDAALLQMALHLRHREACQALLAGHAA